MMKYLIILIVIFAYCTSCSNPRNFTYFKDVSDTTTYYSIPDTGYKELRIKPDDILIISISSPNPEANSFFVTPGVTTAVNSNPASGAASMTGSLAAPSTGSTFLVDKNGGIDVPLIGGVMVSGLTTIQAKEVIKTKVSTYLKAPIVSVRLQNFKITVLGEVNRPANYIVPNERVSILDAIGMAGDLTIFGRRENVLLIREKDGRKVLTRLNLNSSLLFRSPYYYLQQNDIVYVEPNKAKAASNDMAQIRNISIFTSLASLATIIISRL